MKNIFNLIIILFAMSVVVQLNAIVSNFNNTQNLEMSINIGNSDKIEKSVVENVSWCDPNLCGCAVNVQHIACQNSAVLLNY